MSIFQTALTDRRIIEITGKHRVDFLQNLVTQNVDGLPSESCVMAALLTPQGKLLHDFIIYVEDDCFLLDVDADSADALMKKLTLYKLRADVSLAMADKQVRAIWQEDGFPCPPMGGYFEDPRHEGLGLRCLTDASTENSLPEKPLADWHANRMRLGIAQGPNDMPPGSVFPLEYGFAQMQAIDFKKGCFVGQEVTSRTHRKGSLRKKLHAIAVAHANGAQGDAVMAGDRVGGELVALHGDNGLALIREDALAERLTLDGHAVTLNGGLFANDAG